MAKYIYSHLQGDPSPATPARFSQFLRHNKKWSVGLSRFDYEAELDKITAPASSYKKKLKRWVDQRIKKEKKIYDGRNVKSGGKMVLLKRRKGEHRMATVEALRTWKVLHDLDGEKDSVDTDFLKGFWRWLLGRGEDAEHKRTPWGRERLTAPSIIKYLTIFIEQRFDLKEKIAKLALSQPQNIYEAYLFYKYIVRAEWENLNEDEYLSVFEDFLRTPAPITKSKYEMNKSLNTFLAPPWHGNEEHDEDEEEESSDEAFLVRRDPSRRRSRSTPAPNETKTTVKTERGLNIEPINMPINTTSSTTSSSLTSSNDEDQIWGGGDDNEDDDEDGDGDGDGDGGGKGDGEEKEKGDGEEKEKGDGEEKEKGDGEEKEKGDGEEKEKGDGEEKEKGDGEEKEPRLSAKTFEGFEKEMTEWEMDDLFYKTMSKVRTYFEKVQISSSDAYGDIWQKEMREKPDAYYDSPEDIKDIDFVSDTYKKAHMSVVILIAGKYGDPMGTVAHKLLAIELQQNPAVDIENTITKSAYFKEGGAPPSGFIVHFNKVIEKIENIIVKENLVSIATNHKHNDYAVAVSMGISEYMKDTIELTVDDEYFLTRAQTLHPVFSPNRKLPPTLTPEQKKYTKMADEDRRELLEDLLKERRNDPVAQNLVDEDVAVFWTAVSPIKAPILTRSVINDKKEYDTFRENLGLFETVAREHLKKSPEHKDEESRVQWWMNAFDNVIQKNVGVRPLGTKEKGKKKIRTWNIPGAKKEEKKKKTRRIPVRSKYRTKTADKTQSELTATKLKKADKAQEKVVDEVINPLAKQDAIRAENEARLAKEKAANEAKEKAEEDARLARERAEKAANEAREKAEEEARQKAEEDAREKADEEAREKADEEARLAREKAANEARLQKLNERLEKVKAGQEAGKKANQETRLTKEDKERLEKAKKQLEKVKTDQKTREEKDKGKRRRGTTPVSDFKIHHANVRRSRLPPSPASPYNPPTILDAKDKVLRKSAFDGAKEIMEMDGAKRIDVLRTMTTSQLDHVYNWIYIDKKVKATVRAVIDEKKEAARLKLRSAYDEKGNDMQITAVHDILNESNISLERHREELIGNLNALQKHLPGFQKDMEDLKLFKESAVEKLTNAWAEISKYNHMRSTGSRYFIYRQHFKNLDALAKNNMITSKERTLLNEAVSHAADRIRAVFKRPDMTTDDLYKLTEAWQEHNRLYSEMTLRYYFKNVYSDPLKKSKFKVPEEPKQRTDLSKYKVGEIPVRKTTITPLKKTPQKYRSIYLGKNKDKIKAIFKRKANSRIKSTKAMPVGNEKAIYEQHVENNDARYKAFVGDRVLDIAKRHMATILNPAGQHNMDLMLDYTYQVTPKVVFHGVKEKEAFLKEQRNYMNLHYNEEDINRMTSKNYTNDMKELFPVMEEILADDMLKTLYDWEPTFKDDTQKVGELLKDLMTSKHREVDKGLIGYVDNIIDKNKANRSAHDIRSKEFAIDTLKIAVLEKMKQTTLLFWLQGKRTTKKRTGNAIDVFNSITLHAKEMHECIMTNKADMMGGGESTGAYFILLKKYRNAVRDFKDITGMTYDPALLL